MGLGKLYLKSEFKEYSEAKNLMMKRTKVNFTGKKNVYNNDPTRFKFKHSVIFMI